jgi:DNA helicase-2/ATP-dependent DNA helicase PcrA
VLEEIIQQLHYYDFLKDTYEQQEAETKIENVKELLRATTHFEQMGLLTVKDFLAEVALLQDRSNKKAADNNHVQLMTIHAAKGLEFDAVLLSGLEEGSFPSTHALHNPDAIEEERRLFYVGITRAREYLLLSTARYRYTFGSMNDQTSSRFLDEISEGLAARFDTGYWQAAEFVEFFTHWFGTKTARPQILTFGSAKKIESTKPILSASSAVWKKNQSVKHIKFGIGIIQNVETKAGNTTYTINFKSGQKKINAKFLEKI